MKRVLFNHWEFGVTSLALNSGHDSSRFTSTPHASLVLRNSQRVSQIQFQEPMKHLSNVSFYVGLSDTQMEQPAVEPSSNQELSLSRYVAHNGVIQLKSEISQYPLKMLSSSQLLTQRQVKEKQTRPSY